MPLGRPVEPDEYIRTCRVIAMRAASSRSGEWASNSSTQWSDSSLRLKPFTMTSVFKRVSRQAVASNRSAMAPHRHCARIGRNRTAAGRAGSAG